MNWFKKLLQFFDPKHAEEYEEQIDVYLIDVYGQSGKKYCLSFECDTPNDCELMLIDTGLDGDCLGELVEEIIFDERVLH